jgi:hypothetical protein
MQLLRDNLTLWTSDLADPTKDENWMKDVLLNVCDSDDYYMFNNNY